MLPLQYGNGWIVHIDFSSIEHLVDLNYIGKCWAELCRLNDLIGSNKNMIFRFRTKPPEKIYPGYYSRVQILNTGDWMVNANGTTPRNASIWNDATNSPYYESPTCYVKAAIGTLDPVTVAHAIVHELFHLMMPYGLSDHNTSVGWIFNDNMTPVSGLEIITPIATERLLNGIAALSRGYRMMNERLVIIPHSVSAEMMKPGPYPEIYPDFAPPKIGSIIFV